MLHHTITTLITCVEALLTMLVEHVDAVQTLATVETRFHQRRVYRASASL